MFFNDNDNNDSDVGFGESFVDDRDQQATLDGEYSRSKYGHVLATLAGEDDSALAVERCGSPGTRRTKWHIRRQDVELVTDGGRDQDQDPDSEAETVWISAHHDRRAFHTQQTCESLSAINVPVEVERTAVAVPQCQRCQAIENGEDYAVVTARKAAPKKGTPARLLHEMTVEEFDRQVLGRGGERA